jgi:hypothetical protein
LFFYIFLIFFYFFSSAPVVEYGLINDLSSRRNAIHLHEGILEDYCGNMCKMN